jgi:DNA-binding response OmpR family regulator
MVLIVDDHSDSCEALKRLLRREGFEATCARGGQEALTMAEAIRPRMIILDDIMPGLSGLDVLEELRARPHLSRVNVLFLSGFDDPGRKSAAMAMGACDWLMKGIAVWPEIIRAVRACYNKPAA